MSEILQGVSQWGRVQGPWTLPGSNLMFPAGILTKAAFSQALPVLWEKQQGFLTISTEL